MEMTRLIIYLVSYVFICLFIFALKCISFPKPFSSHYLAEEELENSRKAVISNLVVEYAEGGGMAIETSMNSKVYYKNCLYIVCLSFSPCLDLQVNCRCISWTHQILLFFCFAAEISFQPGFFPPVVTRRTCDLTPSKEPIHNSKEITKIPLLLCLEKERTS